MRKLLVIVGLMSAAGMTVAVARAVPPPEPPERTLAGAVTVVKGATVKGAASTDGAQSASGTVRRPAMPSGWHLAAIAPSLAVLRSFEEIPPDLRISEVRTPPKDGRAAAPPHVESKSIKEWLRSLGPEFGDLQRNMLVLVAKEKPEGYVRIREARLTDGVLAVEYTDEAVNPKTDLNPVGGADLVLCARHDVPVAFFENGQAVCRPIPLALQKVTGGLYPTVSRSYPETRTNGVVRTSLAWVLHGQQSRAAVSGGIGYHSAETIWTVPLGPAPSIKSDPPEQVVRGPMCGVATLTSEDLLQRWEVDMRSGTLIGGGHLEGADRERALDELRRLIRVQLARAQADPLLAEDTLRRIERRSASLPQAESGAIAKELADIRVQLPLRRAQACLDQARKEYRDGHRAEAWKNLEFARTAVAKAREAGQRARADELTAEIEKTEKDVDAMQR
jgi:hypothetical protein